MNNDNIIVGFLIKEKWCYYYNAVSVDNEWLPSCKVELEKNEYAWYNNWWWMDKKINAGICLPCFLFGGYELWKQLSNVSKGEMGMIEWSDTIIGWMI